MDETSADGTSALADPKRPGELPGVVVAVPDIDSPAGEVLGDLAGARPAALKNAVGARRAAVPYKVTLDIARSPSESGWNRAASYFSTAAIEVRIRSRLEPLADESSDARCSTAATTPARSANAGVPRSNRHGTASLEGASLSGWRVSSRSGAAITAPICGPDHL